MTYDGSALDGTLAARQKSCSMDEPVAEIVQYGEPNPAVGTSHPIERAFGEKADSEGLKSSNLGHPPLNQAQSWSVDDPQGSA